MNTTTMAPRGTVALWKTLAKTLVLWGSAVLMGVALAAPAQAQDRDIDPPGRVARLAESTGQVWLYEADNGEWVAAVRNRPLTTGDRLATDAGARAELQIGSTSVRIDGASELELLQLDDERAALELHAGSAIVSVRDLAGAGELELSTEQGRFIVQRAGAYRFDRQQARSDLTVYQGQARYEGANSALAVTAGQRAEFWIDSGGVAQYSLLSPVNDAFAAWSSERDRRAQGSISERYVSPEMGGVAELDAYGRWEQTPDYGSVWIPTAVAADWAPYSQGRWAWVRPWGWTWVDDAPWGFAPFHYGRWVYARERWCWTPGTRVVRPVYAPALVAWVGGPRANVSVTIGGGPAVGWFPLGPREVYVPGYRVSSRYARNVNFTSVGNVTLINRVFENPQAPRDFENRHRPRAITIVSTGVFTERRPVGPDAARYRGTPGAREWVGQPGRGTVLVSPPVAAPSFPIRTADRREVQPPPGAAERPRFDGRPGVGAPPRFERNEPDRSRDRDIDRDRDRRATPRDPGRVESPRAPWPGTPQPPAAVTVQPAPPAAVVRPGVESGPGPMRRPFPVERDPRPEVTPATPASPTMRPFPIQRGEERRGEERRDERRSDDRRTEERRPQLPRPEVAPQQPIVEAPRAPRVERPAPAVVAPRPPEAPRPAEAQRPPPAAQIPPAAQTPPAAQAPPAPAAQRPDVRPDTPRDDPRRNDARERRDPREQQR